MPAERAPMRKIREALRLKHSLGLSERQISVSVGVSRSTVAEYLRRASVVGITWPVPEVEAVFSIRRDAKAPRYEKRATFDFSVYLLAMYSAKVKLQAILRNLSTEVMLRSETLSTIDQRKGGRVPRFVRRQRERQTHPEGMAGLDRNRWPTSVGTGGRIASESVADLARITHARLFRLSASA
jgi:IS30 family transposase